MSAKPMTADEIRIKTGAALSVAGSIEDQMFAFGYGLLDVLRNLHAREREHAELLARVERLEAKVMGDGR